MDPFQDFLLSRGEKVDPCAARAAAFEGPVDLCAYPRLMEKGNDQLCKVDLSRVDDFRLTGKREEAREPAEHVVDSVGKDAMGSDATQLARKLALREWAPLSDFASHRPEMIVFPDLDEMRHEGRILAERVGKRCRLGRRGRKAVDVKRERLAVAQSAYQQFVPYEVLQQSLGPDEELVPGMNPQ